MDVFKRINELTTTPVYEPRSEGFNHALMKAQTAVIAALGWELHHAGLSVLALGIFGAGLTGAKFIHKTGWRKECARAHAYALAHGGA